MVYWITKNLGTKSVNEKLRPEEYGSIIIDVRNILDDGSNSPELLNIILGRIYSILNIKDSKVILQCEAGLSRSNALAIALLAYATRMEWEDAVDFVKKKCPRTQINQDLLDQLKSLM